MSLAITAKSVDCDRETAAAWCDAQEVAADHALVMRAKTDRAAVALLYRRHVDRVLNYVERRIGRGTDAEDITANVFLAMVRSLPRLSSGKQPVVAWLYRVATNEINAKLRRKRILSFIGLSREESAPAKWDIHNGEHVRTLLQRLPLRYQEVISMHYLEELSVAKVAAVLRIAEGTVKSRLARGRDMLRIELEKAGHG